MKKYRKPLAYLLLPMILLSALAYSPPADRFFEIAKNLENFATLFKTVNELYVDEINPTKLIRSGIDSMLYTLDPYTNFIPEEEVEDFRTQNTGQYGGIGAMTRDLGNRTVVTMLIEGYPAHKGGLKIGDEVVKIGSAEISRLSRDDINHLMKGQVGTPITLTIKRPGSEGTIQLTFNRENIKVKNVPYSGMVDKDIGYIRLTDFTPDAAKEVRSAFVTLRNHGAKGMVLDLRDNPGGFLNESVDMASIWLDKGMPIVSTFGKIPEVNYVYASQLAPEDTNMPIVVLINAMSASASEIVAGTFQDYDRAVIIGKKSFGKGLVQMSRPLSYKSQLKVTTAKYYTPSGRCIQALDYSHRSKDGNVESVPDSLRKPFKTTHSRTVFDGGGIEPDIPSVQQPTTPFVQWLIEQGYTFDFATLYTLQKPTLQDGSNFRLDEATYQQFVQWMKAKKTTYPSLLETKLNSFSETAKREKYYNDLKPQLDMVNVRVKESIKNGLNLYKEEIKRAIEPEIVSRYFLQKGRVENSLRYDPEISLSISVLHDMPRYKKILNLP